VGPVQVPRDSPAWWHAAGLTGRRAECGVLDRLVEAVRAGESRALVVHGEAGVGKTALLEYLAGHAPGCRVQRAVGVQSEMQLAFAGLHQLCAPMLGQLGALPGPQRDALGDLACPQCEDVRSCVSPESQADRAVKAHDWS
jgi:predicted ATPase